MNSRIMLVNFLTAIFSLSPGSITTHSFVGLNEIEEPNRHVFICPAQPMGGCPKSKGCLYADPDDCHHYYKCVNGNAKQKDCPPNGHGGRLQWDDNKKKCVPKRGRCPDRITTTIGTTAEPTTTPLNTCDGHTFNCPPNCSSSSFPRNQCWLANPMNCNTYFYCQLSGEPAPVTCTNPQEWNDQTKMCVDPPSPTCIASECPESKDQSFSNLFI